MTSSATPENLCSQALLKIGSRSTITSLQEPSTEAIACNTFYATVYENLARTADWNCLRRQAVLSLISSAPGTPTNPSGTTTPYPPTPWLYEYNLPADCLYMRRIIPSMFSDAASSPPVFPNGNASWQPYCGYKRNDPFAVAYDTDISGNPLEVVLTNVSVAEGIYTVNQPNPVIWDSLFQQAFISSLAAYLVPALNANAMLMQLCKADAQAAIAQARVRDGDEGVTSQTNVPPWIRARSGQGSASYPNGTVGLSDMPWPV